MFEYFPKNNYVWNFAVVGALNSGGRIDEVDRACRPLTDIASGNEDVGTVDFLRSWTAMVDALVAAADVDAKNGHVRAAGQAYARAANYLITAERMQQAGTPEREATYQRCLDLMELSFELDDPLTRRVEIPFRDTTLPAYYTRPAEGEGPIPAMIMWNGLDSTKEHQYLSEHNQELAAHGIATLMVDCPGSGEALRKQGLTSQINSEEWASACVDFLEADPLIDAQRIGIVGWSLGGYYAPRAAAFEDRLALCVAWGANHNWGKVQRRRVEREGERPVPHYWDHVMWVWGETDLDAFLTMADDVHLDGVVEKITVPFLIAHGSNDRQIPVEYARRSYDQAVNSPRRELRIFTPEEGGCEHIGLDNLGHVSSFVADWVADAFAEMTSAG
ncbi:alpha/beta fold hydrolase [Gordonia sp. NB41Y]|uniref:alpha/beta hydrolase family protein n=1 Tax=Gordonia sp. NB41Y TaxID=875808 RepID=UPI0002BEA24C|nr:alpha/beta fold hydrolase [Gordonia sp. NB41Y]EMP15383.1 hydrolase [Gordonia sp. NB41Y]WLP90710.1 alpha/beta fold hydrolase [Gordonia sp. NB41Y]